MTDQTGNNSWMWIVWPDSLFAGTEMLRSRIKTVLRCTYNSSIQHNQLNNAAALSFFFLLSLSPLLIFLVSLMALLPIPNLDRHLVDAVSQIVPLAAMKVMDRLLMSIFESNRRLLSWGILGSVWAASTGFNAMIVALNSAYQEGSSAAVEKAVGGHRAYHRGWRDGHHCYVSPVLGIPDRVVARQPCRDGVCARCRLALYPMVRGGGIYYAVGGSAVLYRSESKATVSRADFRSGHGGRTVVGELIRFGAVLAEFFRIHIHLRHVGSDDCVDALVLLELLGDPHRG